MLALERDFDGKPALYGASRYWWLRGGKARVDHAAGVARLIASGEGPSVPAGRSASWVTQCGALLLIFGAAWTLPQSSLYGVTFTGDRLLGLVAVGALVVRALGRRLRWTGVHVTLGAFVATQVFTSILNMKRRPEGLKFSAIYLMGFACFALAAECSRRQADRRISVGGWSWSAAS